MNILPGLGSVVADLKERFGARLDAIIAPRPNEIYFHARMELLAGFCAQLYKKWQARLVSLFADDVRNEEKCFHLYYVFALDSLHGLLVLRIPVSSEQPEFLSLSNAVPAANWQEREVQDLFGLK